MRILYVSNGNTPHDRRFLTKMTESAYEIFAIRLEDSNVTPEASTAPDGVRLVPWSGVRGGLTPEACLRAMPDFSRVLDEVKPDLVHAGPILTAAFMTALAGVRRFVAMSWGSDILVEAKQTELNRWVTQYALAHADTFVVDCDAVREEIQAITGAQSSRFAQLPWGLDLARFPLFSLRERSEKEIVILCTRSWAPIYGIETALDAFCIAHAEESRLRLVLVGDGPLAPVVDAKIAEGRLTGLVRRPGRIAEQALGHHFRSADVYLSCAVSDGTSVSLLEAMAHGLPVVVTDAPGNREWVTPGRGGWLVGAGDAAAFASALVQAAQLEDASRRAIAVWNRAIIDARADWNKNGQRLLAAYDSLMARP